MAEYHEASGVREVPVRVRRTSFRALLLMFLLGIICAVVIAIVALWALGVHSTISWPGGHIQLGQNAVPTITIDH